MGLASFNRMRRERAKVLEEEAKRFDADNKRRWKAHHDRSISLKDYEKETAKVWDEELAANQRIGEKNLAFIEHPEKGDPLKADHAAVMTGENIKGAQEDRTILERLAERIPQGGTAAEVMAPLTGVDSEKPITKEMVDAAREEAGLTEPEKPATPKEAEKSIADAAKEDAKAREAVADTGALDRIAGIGETAAERDAASEKAAPKVPPEAAPPPPAKVPATSVSAPVADAKADAKATADPAKPAPAPAPAAAPAKPAPAPAPKPAETPKETTPSAKPATPSVPTKVVDTKKG